MCVCVYKSQRSTMDFVFYGTTYVDLSLAWGSLTLAELAAPGFLLSASSAGIRSSWHWAFIYGFWEGNWNLYACATSTLLPDHLPSLWRLFLMGPKQNPKRDKNGLNWSPGSLCLPSHLVLVVLNYWVNTDKHSVPTMAICVGVRPARSYRALFLM